ncbi:MAG: dehydratase [Rhodospirillaceae bacterium]|nr:dehydratase [Rhodospirillaceae bacterium]
MARLTRATAKVGDKLPTHIQGPITRTTLALFAGASNDHTPFHIDTDYAKAAGMDDVIAHGMLSMAYLGQLLTQAVPQERLRSWTVRFKAITPVHATVKCTGEILEIFEQDSETRAKLRICAVIDGDIVTLEGEAIVALD